MHTHTNDLVYHFPALRFGPLLSRYCIFSRPALPHKEGEIWRHRPCSIVIMVSTDRADSYLHPWWWFAIVTISAELALSLKTTTITCCDLFYVFCLSGYFCKWHVVIALLHLFYCLLIRFMCSITTVLYVLLLKIFFFTTTSRYGNKQHEHKYVRQTKQ